MKCPNCDQLLLITERQNIEIDYCPSCRGVWLDKGELDKIIEFSNQQLHRLSKNNSDDDYDSYRVFNKLENNNNKQSDNTKDYPMKNYKKKSFFGDLFDFG